jgi:hypothetical protein
MRIDPINGSLHSAPDSANGAGASSRRPAAKPSVMPTRVETSPILGANQHEVSVQVDGDKHTIYRFMDTHTGTLVQQLPPEEVLRVMRNIGEWLQQSQRKLKISM